MDKKPKVPPTSVVLSGLLQRFRPENGAGNAPHLAVWDRIVGEDIAGTHGPPPSGIGPCWSTPPAPPGLPSAIPQKELSRALEPTISGSLGSRHQIKSAF